MSGSDSSANGPGEALRLAIIGCGHWARDAYLPNLVANDEIAVQALCDREEERAAALGKEYSEQSGGRARPAVYSDYEPMFEGEELDVVLVPTLAKGRRDITTAALEAGVHVLAAKPMALSLAEAEEMLRAAEAAQRLLMVGYNYRFRDDARVVKEFIGGGGIGEPRFAHAWIYSPGVPSYAPHYISALSGGGALASTGVHPLDLAVWFMGCPTLLSAEGQAYNRFASLRPLPQDLEAIASEYDTDDLVSGYVRFEGGLTLTTESAWMAPDQIRGGGVEVWGTSGYVSLAPLRLLSWGGEGDYADRTEEVAPGLAATFKDTEVRMQRELLHFFDCVQGRAEPLIGPRDMWTVQAILEGMYTGRKEYGDGDIPSFARR